MLELANEISRFLAKHAKISPNFDPNYDLLVEKYASPDASMLQFAVAMLMIGQKPTYINSDWGSGGYAPYTDKDGEKWHNEILQKLKNL
jgi:hypothetical protein